MVLDFSEELIIKYANHNSADGMPLGKGFMDEVMKTARFQTNKVAKGD